MCQCVATSYKRGDLFTFPVNGDEDAEPIWAIGRILDATATDSICVIHSECFTEYRCTTGKMHVYC